MEKDSEIKSNDLSADGERLKPAKKLKVAYEMPQKRRKAIKAAAKEHPRKMRPEWDRATGQEPHRFHRRRINPGCIRTIDFPLLDVTLGDKWPTPVTIIHGARPGPLVTITGGVHGDELTGPIASTYLTQPILCGEGRPLDPAKMAGTLRIVPVLNPPGYRTRDRYFPDGRDLNREFPGTAEGSTTRRVAHRIYKRILRKTNVLIDLHSAARGRTNLPQIRADLAHPESSRVAKAFGLEVILDSPGVKGSLRHLATSKGIASVVYEGGGANSLDADAIQHAVHGVLNVLRSLHVIPGQPERPAFRLLASGSRWIRSNEGGLIDLTVSSGSLVEAGQLLGRISDPQHPGGREDVISPCRGLVIGMRTNPFVHAGSPLMHILELERHFELVRRQTNDDGCLLLTGTSDSPPWRKEEEVDEIEISGTWEGGSVDGEWQLQEEPDG